MRIPALPPDPANPNTWWGKIWTFFQTFHPSDPYYELIFLSLILFPTFSWDDAAYHLDGDPDGRTFAEILVDVVATEVIEPWGGGKWHLEIFRAASPEPEDWNGEM